MVFNMKIKKYLALSLVILMTTTVLMSGCKKSTSSSTVDNAKGANTDSGMWQPTKNVEIKWGGMITPTDKIVDEAYKKIVEEYKKLHPKVDLKLEYVNTTDDSQRRTWLTTQLIGGVAPDVVMTWHTWAIEDYKKGLVTDLRPYLNKDNPYGKKNQKWLESFVQGLVSQNMDNTSGAYPSLPLSTVAVKIVYNKALFSKAGITQIPQTFDQMQDACQKLMDKGIKPFLVPNSSPGDNVFNWIHRMFMDQMIASILPQLDMDKSGIIELNEIAAGVDKGLIDMEKSPWKDSLPIIKDFSKYWAKGFNGLDGKTAMDLFLKGDGAMMMQTSGVLKTLTENPDRKFDFNVFSFPYLTKTTSQLVVGKLYEMGGAPQNNYCIPSTIKGEKLDAAVNFFQFLTSPQAATIFGEKIWQVTSLKDIPTPPNIGDFVIKGETSSLRLLAPQTNQKLYEDDTKVGQLYLEGKISAEEFNKTLNKDLKDSIEQLKKTNNWNEQNNWGLKK